MAATVKHQPPSNKFIPVSDSSTVDFFLQNVSKDNTAVVVVWAATQAEPAADTVGHILQPGDGMNRNGLTGFIYARGMTGDSIVAMTEEV